MDVTVEPVSPDTWPALVDLFGPGGASNGCWCLYWILGAGYHQRPRIENREQLHNSVTSEHPPGLLAFDESGRAVGWCRFGPRRDLPWLGAKRALAPVDDLPVWSVPCFYIRSGCRGRGVMTALIRGAVDRGRALGIPALEAYPIDTTVEGATRNTFPGVATAFVRAGFEEIARRTPDRPIMRLHL